MIGVFMVTFGEIEHYVNRLIRHQSTPKEIEQHRVKMLDQRLKVLRELLGHRQLSNENRKVLLRLLDEVSDLSKNTRNLVAHNPLVMDLFPDDVSHVDAYSINSERTDRKLSFDELMKRTGYACKVADALRRNVEELETAEELGAEPSLNPIEP